MPKLFQVGTNLLLAALAQNRALIGNSYVLAQRYPLPSLRIPYIISRALFTYKSEVPVSLVVAGLGLAGRIGISCDFRVV